MDGLFFDHHGAPRFHDGKPELSGLCYALAGGGKVIDLFGHQHRTRDEAKGSGKRNG